MSLKAFIDFIELRTKVGSVIPSIIGFCFVYFYFGQLDWLNTSIYFIALLLIDMFTTGWNNYNDFKLADTREMQIETSAVGRKNIDLKAAEICLGLLIGTAFILGIILIIRTNIIVMLISGLFILIGILYTYGPFPISRLPLGELLSSLVLGFGNFFLAVYVNVKPDMLLDLTFTKETFLLSGNWQLIILIFIASLPTIFLVANMMYINNICDYEIDLQNGRHTLISYTGKPLAIKFYRANLLGCYLAIILGIVLKLYPIWTGISFVTLPLLYKNGLKLAKSQDKKTVFATAVQNLIAFNLFWFLGFILSFIF